MNANSVNYVFDKSDLITKEGKDAINRISTEVFNKTGYSVYINAFNQTPFYKNIADYKKDDLQIQLHKQRKAYEEDFLKTLRKPYAIIFFYKDDFKTSLYISDDSLNAEDILEEYGYPYLPLPTDKKADIEFKSSEGLFNIYSATALLLAKKSDVEIKGVPKPMQKPSGMIKGLLYFMIFSLLGTYLFVSYKARSKK